MGRVPVPGQSSSPSPRMNNTNYNPMFNDAPPAPESTTPVYEKPIVQTEQSYPVNHGMVYQPSGGVPMGRPVPPINTNNVGMSQQPYRPQIVPPPVFVNQTSNWTSGLFDCMNDGENAIITFCFPCITFGQIAEIVDEGATSCGTGGMIYSLVLFCLGVPCIYSCTFRAKLRSKFRLPEAPAPDWITHFFCEYCALCQEYRELKNRGFDPTIGWIGNVQRQQMAQQPAMMTPPMGQRMMG